MAWEGDSHLSQPPFNGGGGPGTVTLAHQALTGSASARSQAANLSTMVDVLARAATFDALLDDAAPLNVAVLWCGGNDLHVLDDSAEAAFARIEEWVEGRAAAGWDAVLVGTQLPRGQDGVPVDYETRRQALNVFIRGLAGVEVADVGADATIGEENDDENATYYNADKAHLIEAGRRIAAGYFADALAAVGVD